MPSQPQPGSRGFRGRDHLPTSLRLEARAASLVFQGGCWWKWTASEERSCPWARRLSLVETIHGEGHEGDPPMGTQRSPHSRGAGV